MLSSDNFVEVSDIEVKVTYSFEDAFRKFKSLVQRSNILADYKDRGQYLKPGEARRKKHREALQKRLETDRREAQIISGEWDKIQARKQKRRAEKMAARNSRNENS